MIYGEVNVEFSKPFFTNTPESEECSAHLINRIISCVGLVQNRISQYFLTTGVSDVNKLLIFSTYIGTYPKFHVSKSSFRWSTSPCLAGRRPFASAVVSRSCPRTHRTMFSRLRSCSVGTYSSRKRTHHPVKDCVLTFLFFSFSGTGSYSPLETVFASK